MLLLGGGCDCPLIADESASGFARASSEFSKARKEVFSQQQRRRPMPLSIKQIPIYGGNENAQPQHVVGQVDIIPLGWVDFFTNHPTKRIL